MTRGRSFILVLALALLCVGAAGAGSPRLGLAREPYIGVACPQANSTVCGRVGIAVWLVRRHATRIDATLAGRHVRLVPPKAVGSYWVGFVHLPLRAMGLPSSWAGDPPKQLALRLRVAYADGARSGALRLGLHSGWG
ncbi:MAG TPA: hypothetical protein VFA97_00915 [Gaiellaceae bacterium]|nr:hypothetical protein [Gaiellaceae bacterium]